MKHDECGLYLHRVSIPVRSRENKQANKITDCSKSQAGDRQDALKKSNRTKQGYLGSYVTYLHNQLTHGIKLNPTLEKDIQSSNTYLLPNEHVSKTDKV